MSVSISVRLSSSSTESRVALTLEGDIGLQRESSDPDLKISNTLLLTLPVACTTLASDLTLCIRRESLGVIAALLTLNDRRSGPEGVLLTLGWRCGERLL
mmetsp:Transcript_78971/g.183197  ORF Transcript_78971/g.183197 Transcript_78971/m.183197 type:complete len:100 (+) Transcript_78971:623-922(+)